MAAYKHIDKICCAILAVVLVVTVIFLQGERVGITEASHTMGYEERLFDISRVHTLDIEMEDWDGFLETCTNEEYVDCSLTIDQEEYSNVAIRAKGNTSLQNVAASGGERYSFKIEFDHYEDGKTYHGLDKLCLNNIIQDNTYLKDYLCYQMMAEAGAVTPLCSFVYITVNGEDWGLYLAVEGVEEGFLERNYGSDYGELYKPDTTQMGGGGMRDQKEQDGENTPPQMEEGAPAFFDPESAPEQEAVIGESGSTEPQMPQRPDGGGMGGGRSMGSSDVSLIYTDDDPDSYSNIFNNAKTDISEADQERLIDALRRLGEGEDLENTVDIDANLRYFIVHNFVCNFDSYTGSMIHNYYLYEEDGVLSMIPWDYNLAFGGFMGGADATDLVNYPIDTPVSGGTVESRPMLAWIFQDETYTQMYHDLFQQWIDEYFASGTFAEEFDRVVEMITPYVEKDPTKFCTTEEFETGAATLREFCLLRAESVQGQLDGTIPATEEGQQEDNSTLIDASSLSISDMGSMGMGGGRGGEGGEERGFPGRGMQAMASEDELPAAEETPEDPASVATQAETESTEPPAEPSQEGPASNEEAPPLPENADTAEPPQGGPASTEDAQQPPDLAQGGRPGNKAQPEEGGEQQAASSEEGTGQLSSLTNDPASTEQQADSPEASDTQEDDNRSTHSFGGPGGMPQMPGFAGETDTTPSTGTTLALLGGSATVLLLGLFIAWRFRH